MRTWVGFVYVAFVVDCGYLPLAGDFAQRIVGWHAMTTKLAELVLIPLRMAAWSRGQQGHPVTRSPAATSLHTPMRGLKVDSTGRRNTGLLE